MPTNDDVRDSPGDVEAISGPNPSPNRSRRERWVWLAARLQEHAIGMARRNSWPTDLVEDACQDVSIKVFEHLDLDATIDENSGRIHAWLRTTFHNRMIDLLRRRGHDAGRLDTDAEIENAVTSLTSRVGRQLDNDLLLDQVDLILLARGNQTTREVLDLARRQQLSNGEIAKKLGLHEGTIRRHLALIKKLIETDPTLRRFAARTDGD